MDLELRGKIALVTGSTAGIGIAIASRLAREGAHVWVSGRTDERVEAAIRSIQQQIPEAQLSGVAADIGTSAGAATIVGRVPVLDILVNNAGIFEPRQFDAIDDEAWRTMLEVNLMSGVRLSRHYLPAMLAANTGRIVFIASESAVQIPAEMIHYGVSKTAQVALARGLAELTVGTRVTVNSVLPGPTRSEGVSRFIGQLASGRGVSEAEVERDFFATARPSSLLRRFESPEEIANVVAFVVSPLASTINGAAVRADGGIVRSIL